LQGETNAIMSQIQVLQLMCIGGKMD